MLQIPCPIFQVRTHKPLEEFKLGGLANQHVFGNRIDLTDSRKGTAAA